MDIDTLVLSFHSKHYTDTTKYEEVMLMNGNEKNEHTEEMRYENTIYTVTSFFNGEYTLTERYTEIIKRAMAARIQKWG